MTPVAALLASVEIGLPLVRGPLSLFPLFSELPPAPPYATGPHAAGLVHVDEVAGGARVPTLAVRNDGGQPVLLLDGEALVGARQNRVLDVSVLVPPKSQVAMPVSCVEAGRWGAHRPVQRSARHTPGRLRAANRSRMAASVHAGRQPAGDQALVWAEVDRYAAVYEAVAPTRALEDVHVAVADRVADLVGGTAPLPGQRGVVAAVGGTVIAVDLFDCPSTLAAHWDALVAGHALDALDATPAELRRRDVRAVLGALAAAPARPAAGVGLGETHHLLGEAVAGTALSWDGAVVHLAAGPVDRTRPDGPHRPRRRWFGDH